MREFALRPLLLAGALAEPSTSPPSLLHVLRLFRIVVLTDYLVLPNGIAPVVAYPLPSLGATEPVVGPAGRMDREERGDQRPRVTRSG